MVVLVISGGSGSSADSGSVTTADTQASSGTAQASSDTVETPPPGVAADQTYIELSTSDDGPVVDVYLDFLCPHCATFHDVNGADLQELAEAGAITLRAHPRPMLDDRSTPPTGYSGRAANAALSAYAQDPEAWWDAESALYANQPGAEGLTDDELISIIEEATGLDVSDDVAEGTYIPWLEDVVEPEASEQDFGTPPVVVIDGVQSTADWSVEGALREEIEQAS